MDTGTDGIRKIADRYEEFYKSFRDNGRIPSWSTDIGVFGTFPAEVYNGLFIEIELKKYKKFLDLGSGDGKAVNIASLYTNAYGIEFDKRLYGVSCNIKDDLGLKSTFHNRDYMTFDISSYDLIMINPDKDFSFFEEKLIKEMEGDLLVCNHIFLPRFLKKKKTIWIDQIPFYIYTKV